MGSSDRALVVVTDRYSRRYGLDGPIRAGDNLVLSELKELGDCSHGRFLGDKTADPFRLGELKVLGVAESHLELGDIAPENCGDNSLLMAGLPVRVFVTSGKAGKSIGDHAKTVFEVSVDPLSIPGFTQAYLKSESKWGGYETGAIVQPVEGPVYLETSGKRYMFDPRGGGRISVWDRQNVSGLGDITKLNLEMGEGSLVEISPQRNDKQAVWIRSNEPDFGANGYFKVRLASDVPDDPLEPIDLALILQTPKGGYASTDINLYFRYGHKKREDATDYNSARTFNQGVLGRAAAEFEKEQSNRRKTTRTYLVGRDGELYEDSWFDRERAQKKNLLRGPGNLLVSFEFDRSEKTINVLNAVPAPQLNDIPNPKKPVDHHFNLKNNAATPRNFLPDSIALLGNYMNQQGQWHFNSP